MECNYIKQTSVTFSVANLQTLSSFGNRNEIVFRCRSSILLFLLRCQSTVQSQSRRHQRSTSCAWLTTAVDQHDDGEEGRLLAVEVAESVVVTEGELKIMTR